MIDFISALIHFLIHVLPIGFVICALAFGVGVVVAYLLFRSAETDCADCEERSRLLESRRKLLQEDCITIEKSLGELDVDCEEAKATS